jgi:DNA-binding SARP family transcriptional activator
MGNVLDILRAVTGAEAADVFLADPGQRDMVLSWHRGSFRHAFMQILRFTRGEGYPGLVLANREPIASDCLATDPRFLRWRVKEQGFGSYVCVPLDCSWGTIGSLGMAFRHPDVDLQRGVNVLSWVSVPLGITVEAYLLGLRDTFNTSIEWMSGDQGESFSETAKKVLSLMIDMGGAQGGSLSLLGGKAASLTRRITEGLASRSPCPTLSGDPLLVCPALAGRQGIALNGPRDGWPPPCRPNPKVVSVRHCIPLFADGEAVGLCQLNYHRLGTLPPTWNLASLEVVGNAAGQAVQKASERLERQRRAEAVTARLLQQVETERQPSLGAPAPQRAHSGAQTPYLDIRCFGSFEVCREGALITPEKLHRRKVLTLLKILLAHEGRPLSKDTLIEFLWPEGSPEIRAGQLYVLVHELRKLLEPPGLKGKWLFIRNDGDRYYFSYHGSCRSDVREFNSLIKLGREAEAKGDTMAAVGWYEAVVELHRGDFMEDEPFADWCQQERERLREAHIDVLERLASLYGSSGEWSLCAKCLRAALRVDSLREEIHRALMYSLWAGGRRDEAVRQYDLCKALLRRELDVSPLPDTERLVERIRAQPGP